MLLAISLRPRSLPQHAPFDRWYYCTDHYQKLFDALGVPLLPYYSRAQLAAVAGLCDGLVLTGNVHDIPPHYYGAAPLAGRTYEDDDFALDDWAIRLFASQDKPILGICAGMQSINVSFGGTLCQSVPGHDQDGGDAPHNVALAPGSFLAGAYGAQEVRTNTFHHQAADAVAPGFAVTARAADDVIEGIERGRIIGVQWHPEASLDMPLFARFADLCRQG